MLEKRPHAEKCTVGVLTPPAVPVRYAGYGRRKDLSRSMPRGRPAHLRLAHAMCVQQCPVANCVDLAGNAAGPPVNLSHG